MQAEKGDVLNPKGKEPGTKSFKKILRDFLSEKITLETLAEHGKITKKQAMMLLTVQTAINEDEDPNVRLKAVEFIAKKMEGDATQKFEIKNKGDKATSNEVTPDQVDKILKVLGNGNTDSTRNSKASRKQKG